jgi:hypothetical protein
MVSAVGQTPFPSGARDYFAPALGDDGKVVAALKRIEITLLSRPEYSRVTVIQMTKLGAEKPDGLGLEILQPSYPGDTASGLYCYMSTVDGKAFKLLFNGDFTTPLYPLSDDAKAAMAQLADKVADATKDLTSDRLGSGIARNFPDTAFAALDRVLNIPGGCSRPATARKLGPVLDSAASAAR